MDRNALINLIDSLELDIRDFVILSSGALVLRNIMDTASDLDIAVTEKGFEKLKNNYQLKEKEFIGWYNVTDKIECVVNDMKGKKEKLGKYYVQDINDYLEYLKNSSRSKDQLRIPKVVEYIKNKEV